ncbi:MAG: hypothetical protein EOM40_05470 [Clostridia bacterium]|nr:hypothetical protein [Clostridia bacterium]
MRNRSKKIAAAVGCTLLVVGIGLYGWRAYYYSDKFFAGTKINQVECAGLTAEQAEELIRSKVEDYQIQIEFRDDVTEEIAGTDIDYKYVSDQGVEKLINAQNPLFWIKGVFAQEEYRINEDITFDAKKLEEKVKELKSMQEDAQTAPEDAYVTFEKDEFVIVDETYGTKIDTEKMQEAVSQAVSGKSETLSVEEAKAYVMPVYTKDSELVLRQQEQLNELAKVSVTYQLPTGEKVFDGDNLRKWLDVDEEGNYSRDDEKFKNKIKNYVKKLAKKVDTVGKERPFHTTSGLDVTVEGGNYGWKIDQGSEIEKLTENIEKQEIVSREPEYSSEEKYTENNGLGTTYIEVNLTEQHLYYYKDNEMVLDTPLVSGRMTRDRFTPPGVYFLTYKTTDRVLRGAPGADGQPSYEAHVNFWMPFNRGIGLHDASWRGTYGGTIYKYSGSHGCINLPYKKAKAIYKMIDEDTPIICVYNDGYSFN